MRARSSWRTKGLQRKRWPIDFLTVDGTANKMRERMESGLPGAVAQLTSSFEGLLLTLGKSGLTGFLTSAAKALTKGFNRWLAASSPFVQTLPGRPLGMLVRPCSHWVPS